MKALAALVHLLLLGVLMAAPATSQTTRYLAFGDSVTEGAGDDEDRGEDTRGYPPRLEAELLERGVDALVENHGRGGETTAAGVTRIDEVLLGGGDVLLLMEGTNDVSRRISRETIRFNLNEIARKAEAAGLRTVHLTVIPRLPSANTDGTNRATAALAGEVRDLARDEGRDLADPYEVFSTTPDLFAELYVGGTDKLHPNAAGHDLLSRILADQLTGIDVVPPVTGRLEPEDEARDVAADSTLRLNLYDFGAGIDLANTSLLVNGETVDATFVGDGVGAEISYQPAGGFQGAVSVGLVAQDLAVPPNRIDRTLARFLVAGTVFLAGDLNEDGRVDGADLVAFALRFGTLEGEARYATFADLNDDGRIDGSDLAILASDFGESSF